MPVERQGRTIDALVHPGRNGYLWTLERSADDISFVDAEPYVYQNAFASLGWKLGVRPDQTQTNNGSTASFVPRCGVAKIGLQPPQSREWTVYTGQR